MDGASGGGKAIGDPEGLLRSALEKIVFFECRVSQLESELAAALGVAERARGEAAKAHRREVELDQAAAGERGARAGADRRAAELEERVRLLEAERERLLAGLVDRARVSGAPDAPGSEEGGTDLSDLAGFIAELRAEIEALRGFKAAAEAAGFQGDGSGAPQAVGRRALPASTVTDVAARFEHAGRVGLTARDAERMKDLLATRADRALYERSMDDLAAADAGRRLRAVRALGALGSKASAPLLAAALGREPDAQVKAALLSALARFGEPFVADLAAREASDARPAVRIAALDALVAVAGAGAEERLAAALEDPSPLVRRRAALLLGFTPGEGAEKALAVALADADRGVARAAAAALSGRPSAHAQGALARGLEHPDGSVRRAAASALSRLAGERVEADGPAHARRAASRRIAERLAGMNGEEIRAAVLRGADAVTTAAPPPAPAPSPRGAREERAAIGEAAMTAAPVTVTVYARAMRPREAANGASPLSRTGGPSPRPRAGGGGGMGEGAGPGEGTRAPPAKVILYPRALRGERAVNGASALPCASGPSPLPRTTTVPSPLSRIGEPSPLPRTSEPSPRPSGGGGEGKGEGAGEGEGAGDGLAPGILAELRAALRGCTTDALAAALGAPGASVDAALRSLAAGGRVALRGTRWFTT